MLRKRTRLAGRSRVVFRRLMAVAICALCVTTIAAPAAHANPPSIQWFTEPVTFVLPADTFCAGFDTQVDIQQKAKVITFAGDQGAMFAAIGTGQIFATLTNLLTGYSITRNISGPAFFDSTGLPYVGTGTWFIYLPGDPGSILYLVGRMNFVPEPYGISPSLVRGRSIDMCSLL